MPRRIPSALPRSKRWLENAVCHSSRYRAPLGKGSPYSSGRWRKLYLLLRACDIVLRMNLASYEPYLRSLLRIIVGITFSLHGWQKFFGAFGGLGGQKAELASLMGVA